MTVLRVAVPSPLRRLFDYLPPPQLKPGDADSLRPGARLTVPFGNREITAILVAVTDHSEVARDALKPALALLDPQPLIPPALFDLCRWTADYYHHPVGEVLPAAFPVNLRKGRPPLPAGEAGWRLSARGLGLPEGALARSPKQAEAIRLLQENGEASTKALVKAGISRAVIKALSEKELVDPCTIAANVNPPRANPGIFRGFQCLLLFVRVRKV